ncbi:tripartite tricarboxylate transporter substrate binding protein [Xenophilus azovorans]|uniref:tripartite tricarboxylate transporter substrate binding protein n=1 Tax=Xenophilus azovorans TaxID=151755 RepID=UPI00068C4A9F|nr:tripartite tricarboxylate transporter substrate binding protein [Xenophilus azovorans]
MIHRRACLAALALAAACTAHAQRGFPIAGKPVTLILPAVGGSTGDRVLRMFAERLKDDWKVPVVVDAKPGASGVVGTVHAVNAAPDGHTILLGYSHLTQAYAFEQKRPYDALTDLIPVARICDLPMLLLTADTSVRTLDEQIAKLRTVKGSYGSYGNATTSQIYSELVDKRNGLGMVHAAYKGTPPLVTDLLGGQIDTAVIDLGNTMGHVKAGKLRALAITGEKRNKLVPDVPTFAELGYDEVSQPGRYWLMLPKGTPPATVERIRASVLDVLKSPELQEQLYAMGIEPAPPVREDVAANMRADVDYWKRVVEITGRPVE